MDDLRVLLCLLVYGSCAIAQDSQLSGDPWVDMDYGPFLSMTIEAEGPGRNIAYKGVMVTLDEATQTYALFDEDLMRVAAAWTGGKLNWRSVVYDGSHGTHPSMVGRQMFGTRVQPGWSLTGDFADPREMPYGPLPRGIAHYKGLYVHEDRVVFEYTVGGSLIRESPGLERFGDNLIVTRTIEVPRSRNNMTLAVADGSNLATSLVRQQDRDFAVLGEIRAAPPEPEPPVLPERGRVALIGFEDSQAVKRNGATLTAGRGGQVLRFSGRQQAEPRVERTVKFGGRDYSICAWLKTKRGGTVAAVTSPGKWVSGGRSLFVRGGRLAFDIGWVGVVAGKTPVADGRWHHVAVTHDRSGRVRLYVDGKPDGSGRLESPEEPPNARVVLGATSDNFPGGAANRLVGDLDDVAIYNRVLGPAELRSMAPTGPPPGITAASVVGLPKGAQWRLNDASSLRLHIPADATPTRFKVLQWAGQPQDFDDFRTAALASPEPESLQPLTTGGPSRFPETVTTRGRRGEGDQPYVIDELVAPTDNPWRSWMRFGGFDFFDDPTKAAICTWNGDVWIVSGITDSLEELVWKRIASGMFQPLGLRIVDGDIYVACRDQITVLRDLNGDGEADFYQNFNNDHQVTEHFHEFAMDLQTDARGNFYYAKSARHALDSVVPHHGTLIRVSPDGRTSEIVCNGFRAANGVGIGPNGEMSTSDQEGHWTPANRINLVRDGGFYGNMYSYHRGERPSDYDPPVVWLPKNVDRSPAESLWVTSDKWGPLQGRLISTSYGTGQLFLVPYERLGAVYQGGAIRFPFEFPTGTMRARFHPVDGQLYVCGLFGWSSNKTQPGGFYRIRYTGKAVHMPVEYHVKSNGIALTFAAPLDRTTAQDPRNYGIEQWNYRWTKNYGSAHWKVSNPKEEGADEVRVKSATLLSDDRTVFLEIEDLQPVMQMHFSWSLKDAQGAAFEDDMYATINRLGPEFKVDKVMDTPREIGARRELQPGLMLSFLAKEEQDPAYSFVTRLAAVSPIASVPAQRVRLQGYLRVSRPGNYRFRVAGVLTDGLLVGGAKVQPDRTVNLPRGDHGIVFESAASASARVEWSGDGFDWEPIPPAALWHRSDVAANRAVRLLHAGRDLFLESGCVRCHQTPAGLDVAGGIPELNQSAPSLAEAGSRFRPEWLRDWILDPHGIRPDTTMPAVLHGGDAAANADDAMHIAAYLSTLGSSPETESESGQGGRELFEDLGCIACHRTTLPQEADDYGRRSLHHVDRKYKPAALEAFLRNPHAHHASRAMPDFALNAQEAAAIASFLRSETPDPADFTTQGNPRRGRELFGSVGCANCHSISDQPPRGEMRKLSVVAAGCLAAAPEQRGEAPDFRFSEQQRSSLQRFLENGLGTLAYHAPALSAQRAVTKLNCTACHNRDLQVGRYREIYAEEGSQGRIPELIPPLTWAGEKFQTDWMAKYISGEDKSRLRPHLRVRMPRFGAYGHVIAAGLAHQHGVNPETNTPEPGVELAAAGRKLVGRAGGFNCIQCHGVGDQKPTAAFDALGVNLEQIPARIRRPFYDRWMLDPPRIDPSTKMIKLATDGRTSIADVLDGDAAKQFDAIWQYLHTLKK